MKYFLLVIACLCVLLPQIVFAEDQSSTKKPGLKQAPILKSWTGDLDGMIQRRVIRALVAPSRTAYWLNGARQTGAEYELLKAFEKDQDIHRATAAEVFGVAPEKVTSDQRRSAKAINFGLIYGMSAFGLARQLGIGREEAQGYVDLYFARYPGVKFVHWSTFGSTHGSDERAVVAAIPGKLRALKADALVSGMGC